MRKLTKEELEWVTPEQFEYCDCDSINCPVCNTYMSEEDAAPFFEDRIASEIERAKRAEAANQREKAILAKPESERTSEENLFILQRKMLNRLVENAIVSVNKHLDSSVLNKSVIVEPKDGDTIRFRRPPRFTVE